MILVISRSFLLRMRNVSDNIYGEDQKTHFVFNNFFFENRAVYEIMWIDMVEMTIWRMRIACWITKVTNIHSENVIFVVFIGNNGCTNAPQSYVIRTLSVLLILTLAINTLTTRFQKFRYRTISFASAVIEHKI